MRGYAKIIIAGNLTRDPELRSTQSGRNVASFGVAVNRNRRDASGNNIEETTFYNCSAWGQPAENISKYLHKGDPILLSGRPRQDTWRDRNGADRISFEIDVDDFVFLNGGNRDNAGSNRGYSSYGASAGAAPSDDFVPNDIPDGDVALDNPFNSSAPASSATAKQDAQEKKATKGSKAAKNPEGADLSGDADKVAKGSDAGEVVLDENMDISLDEVPF